jgi:hypothetical protein
LYQQRNDFQKTGDEQNAMDSEAVNDRLRRVKMLASLAKRWGVELDRRYAVNLPSQYKGFAAIDCGRANNVLSGSRNNRKLIAFDYEYHYEGPVRHMSVLAIGMLVECPDLRIRPGKRIDTPPNLIQFESDEFNRRFCIQGPDRQFAYDVINPQVMEYLLTQGQWWRLELLGAWLMVTNADCEYAVPSLKKGGGNEWERRRYEAALVLAEGVLDRVPEFVWKDWKADGKEMENFLPREHAPGTAAKHLTEKPGTSE